MKNALLLIFFALFLVYGCAEEVKEEAVPYQEPVIAEPEKPLAPKEVPLKEEALSIEVPEDESRRTCTGDFFDSHLHLERGFGEFEEIPLNDGADTLSRRMKETGVGCSVVFLTIDPESPIESAESVKEALEGHDEMLPFIHVDEDSGVNKIFTATEKLLPSFGDLFAGLGEYAFYEQPLDSMAFSEEPWPSMFRKAAEENKVIMIHPRDGQANELASALRAYPNTKILVHGWEIRDDMPNLLKQYPNVYYTADVAGMLASGEGRDRDSFLFPESSGESAKAEFVRKYDSEREQLLNKAIQDYGPIIAAAPNRVLWGTDVSEIWHYETEIYSRVMEFSKLFLERLPQEQRRPYAHDNAMKLFGLS